MQKNLNNNSKKIQIKRIPQITDSHCGPAVVQMLLNNIGIDVTQERIAQAAGVLKTIDTYGTRIDQLASALKQLVPQARLWYKKNAQSDDIRILLRDYNYPVGVEWQGIFEKEDEEDDETDYGHYSVITHIDDERKALIIVDPYKDFTMQDRIISIHQFVQRWWDTNEVVKADGKKELVKDARLLFVITPNNFEFPAELHLLDGASELKPL